MSSRNPDDLLTDAARRAVGELTNGYRTALLEEAIRVATAEAGDAREIAMQDVIRAAQRVGVHWADLRTASRQRSLDRVLTVYSALGWVMAGGAVGLFALERFSSFGISGNGPFAYVVPIVGVYGLALIGAAEWMRRRRAERRHRRFVESLAERDPAALSRRLVAEWIDLESMLRGRASSIVGDAAASTALGELFSILASAGALTTADSKRLRDILAFRNEVVHRGVGSEAKAKDLLADLVRIKEQLSQLAV